MIATNGSASSYSKGDPCDHHQQNGKTKSHLETSTATTAANYANGISNHHHKHLRSHESSSSHAEHENSMSMSSSANFDLNALEIKHDGSDGDSQLLNRVDSSTVLFITGGGSGLGEATARRFSKLGARISIFDIKSSADKLVLAFGADKCLFTQGDVNNDEELSDAIDATIKKFGKISLNVNCAGIGSHSLLYDSKRDKMHSEKSFYNVLKVNLIGTFNAMRYCSKAMAKNGGTVQNGSGGVIINTGSISGSDGQSGQLAYCASKGGLESMTLPAARDLASLGIRVVTISPGFFDTPLLRQAPEQYVNQIPKNIALCPKRLGHPDEYAHLVQSIYENPMLNGTVIRLDSGSRLPASMF